MQELILVPMNSENFEEARIMMEESFAASMKDFPENFEVNNDEEDEGPSLEGVLDRPEATPLVFYLEDNMVGGAVLNINEDNNNTLELFYIDWQCIDSGIGYRSWLEIEKKYPQTKTWNTVTPTCLMRNVHFYVNKCGFHIIKVEDPKSVESMFVFEKVMK